MGVEGGFNRRQGGERMRKGDMVTAERRVRVLTSFRAGLKLMSGKSKVRRESREKEATSCSFFALLHSRR